MHTRFIDDGKEFVSVTPPHEKRGDAIRTDFVEKRGNKWVVLDHTRKKVLGSHPTREAAVAQLQAIEAAKARKASGQ